MGTWREKQGARQPCFRALSLLQRGHLMGAGLTDREGLLDTPWKPSSAAVPGAVIWHLEGGTGPARGQSWMDWRPPALNKSRA